MKKVINLLTLAAFSAAFSINPFFTVPHYGEALHRFYNTVITDFTRQI